MTTIEAEAAVVLRSAAEHLERTGFFQGTWFAPQSAAREELGDRPCCVLGAIGYEAGYWFPDKSDPSDYNSVSLYGTATGFRITPAAARAANLNEVGRWALGKSLALDYPDEVDFTFDGERSTTIHPPEWNDAEGRTQEEAVAALRAAADRLEAGTFGQFPPAVLYQAA